VLIIKLSDTLQKVKVKFSPTRFGAMGQELIPVYRQSAHRQRCKQDFFKTKTFAWCQIILSKTVLYINNAASYSKCDNVAKSLNE